MTKTHSNILALDVGDKRIGVAVASRIARLPSTHGVIENNKNAVNEIKKLVLELDIDEVVVGLPRNLNGQNTSQTNKALAFAAQLKHKIGLPVFMQDEALTSVKARQELDARKIGYNKEHVDALAATYILDDYLEQSREQVS